jgi:hypothetical protein
VATANITPDPTGIGCYDEVLFINVVPTILPAKRRVDNTEPPKICRIDGHKHGLGGQN